MNRVNQSLEKAKEWLKDGFDQETKNAVQELLKNEEELVEAFSEDLAFGTGGMRGIMGVGSNRINKYTLGKITQGLANYINKSKEKNNKVVIAHDVRHNSKEFCALLADVLSANGIEVYIFDDFRPTPLLSYAVRALDCISGIVLTASHNPPEYNGYKVYWSDGGQVVPPIDKEIVACIDAVDYTDVNFKSNTSLVKKVPKTIEDGYLSECVAKNQMIRRLDRSQLKIVFTPIHGTSVHLLPKLLEKCGFTDLLLVKEQCMPSGDFPTVVSPNPEEPEALAMATKLAVNTKADILMGTDPDADRLGIGVRNTKGEIVLLNGNETNTIITYFLLDQLKSKKELTPNSFIGSTIVSSDIFPVLADFFGVAYKLGLTGFKWIAKMIADANNPKDFICGGEESYGALVGDFVRDKDALGIANLVCEIACYLKSQNTDLLVYLDSIYEKLGFYKEELISIKKEGVKGKEEIEQLMHAFRTNPPNIFLGEKLTFIEDYQSKPTRFDVKNNKKEPIDIESANVLIFRTENNTKVAVRPSGTEPKIKFYLGITQKVKSNLGITKAEVKEKMEALKLELKKLTA